MKSNIRVVIADDHSIFRKGLAQVITSAGHELVGEASDGEVALRCIRETSPQVAVLDIDMPTSDGFSVARTVRQQYPGCALAFLTMYKDELHLEEALNIGVRGYVVKEDATNEIVSCISSVAAGGTYISPSLSAHLVQFVSRASAQVSTSGVQRLTPVEKRILDFLIEFKTSKDIAADLGISPRTVENHRAHICEKLNLRGTHALIRFAMERHRRLLD